MSLRTRRIFKSRCCWSLTGFVLYLGFKSSAMLVTSHLSISSVTLLAGPTFLHIKPSAPRGRVNLFNARRDNQSMRQRCCQLLALSSWLRQTRVRLDNQSMRERCCRLLAQAKRSIFFFSYKRSLTLTRLEG